MGNSPVLAGEFSVDPGVRKSSLLEGVNSFRGVLRPSGVLLPPPPPAWLTWSFSSSSVCNTFRNENQGGQVGDFIAQIKILGDI